eukprot:TRINITY_DN140_c2_g1_i1.p1 TRINITY_DN140_c2_g1~~TRINITY_DN140_c2_g1_i1.p1  ORF type:complete len:341 (+),score=100.47 TRINITY_DN140_c2_g1_i1:128-1024(+)
MEEERGEEFDYIEMEFEGQEPREEHLEGVAHLLRKFLDEDDFDFEGASRAFIDQSPLGCALVFADDSSSAVYAVSSMYDVSAAAVEKSGDVFRAQLSRYLRKCASEGKPFSFSLSSPPHVGGNACTSTADLRSILDTQRVGVIVCERVDNVPAEVALRMHLDLHESLDVEKFDYFILMTPFGEFSGQNQWEGMDTMGEEENSGKGKEDDDEAMERGGEGEGEVRKTKKRRKQKNETQESFKFFMRQEDEMYTTMASEIIQVPYRSLTTSPEARVHRLIVVLPAASIKTNIHKFANSLS